MCFPSLVPRAAVLTRQDDARLFWDFNSWPLISASDLPASAVSLPAAPLRNVAYRIQLNDRQLCCSLACQLMELCLQLGCTAVPHGSVPPLRRESRGKISFSLSLPVQVRALNFALQRRDSAAYDNGINSWNTLSAGGGQTEESAKENYTLGLEEFSLARVLLKDTLAVLFTWWVTFCRQTSSCICHFLVDNER